VIVFAATIRNLLSQSKLSQLKSDFINNMGHELKTPLATISLAADAINHPSTIDQPDKVRSFTGMIQQERERMYAHIERVLQMAQSESGQFTISKRPVEVADLVHGAVACVQAQIDQSNAEVHLSLPDHPVSIKADREHLEAALVNLIDNALKYNDQTPIVHLTVKALPTETHVAVHDNGIGISKENQRHVFSRFFRAQSGNLHGVKGFGLGLSYVQAVAMAHGGKVTLESELDMGSTFTIKLPNA
jgi:two-component system phosphate regulon sensor histidine kinase PhoR